MQLSSEEGHPRSAVNARKRLFMMAVVMVTFSPFFSHSSITIPHSSLITPPSELDTAVYSLPHQNLTQQSTHSPTRTRRSTLLTPSIRTRHSSFLTPPSELDRAVYLLHHQNSIQLSTHSFPSELDTAVYSQIRTRHSSLLAVYC